MKKIWITIIIGVMCFMSMFALAACSKSISKITDIARYSDMQKVTERIDVEFDNNSGKAFFFSITEETEITEIMELLFSETLIDLKSDYPPGDNTYLTIVQGEKNYTLSVRANKENKNYYSFKTNTLQTKINAIARERGAYDGVE